MNDLSKILDRVRKLLRLAEKSPSEHEAALAADQAAKLMKEWNLSEAMLRLDEPNRPAEPLTKAGKVEGEDPYMRKRVAWKGAIAHAVARRYGAKFYWQGSTPTCFGRESAVQAWSYTCQYLYREVDRLADTRWKDERLDAEAAGQSARAWKNGFRVGAAQSISIRLIDALEAENDERKAVRREVQAQAMHSDMKPEDRALILLDKDEEEVKTAYDKFSKDFVSTRSIGTVRSRNGFYAGREAGHSVPLGGGRAGIGPGKPRLKP